MRSWVRRFALLLLAISPVGQTLSAEEIVSRARKIHKSDKKLGRAYLSLALHLDPFVLNKDDSTSAWARKGLKGEPLGYWQGNAYVGHDKTLIESLLGRDDLFNADVGKSGLAIISWKNLDLTGLSCCGMDNVAVYFSQNNMHLYVAPFIDLVPGYGKQMKPENLRMYTSFKEWWESTGRRSMPEPAVIHRGHGLFEWEAMKVVLKASRVPEGFNELIQAVLLRRFMMHEEARVAANQAIAINPELNGPASELLSGLGLQMSWATPRSLRPERKYVINYNPHVGLGNLAVVMVSSRLLAQVTGRTFVLSWNVNTEVRKAFKLQESSDVHLLENSVEELGVAPQNVKNMYFFHMMYSPDLGDMLELLGCSDIQQELSAYPVVSMSSNLFFGPIVASNPHSPPGTTAEFPDMLKDLFAPSDESAERAVEFLRKTAWRKEVPVVGIHIRAREEGEDNDDWPTASSPAAGQLSNLRKCVELAIKRELPRPANWFGMGSQDPQFDVYVASTTEKARKAVASMVKNMKGVRNVLSLSDRLLNRKSGKGTVDAMAEALLLSRSTIFMRLVIGTSGFSTFAYMSNALSHQNAWLPKDLEHLTQAGYQPNYLVTDSCNKGRCFVAPPRVRMADIAWHGNEFVMRSCGDVLGRVRQRGTEALGCRGLESVDIPMSDAGEHPRREL